MKMSRKEAKAVLLRMRGLKIKEIAAVLEVSERTVKRYLHKARNMPPGVVNLYIRQLFEPQQYYNL